MKLKLRSNATLSRSTTKRSFKKFKKQLMRFGLFAVNGIVLLSILGVLVYGRQTTRGTATNPLQSVASTEATAVLDQISSADIALSVAEAVRLPEADQVRNQADSRNALVSIAVSDDVVVSKPQIVTEATSNTQSRADIIEHLVAPGETVGVLAERFGVSSNSIRWSNGVTGDTLVAGRTIVIPPKNRSGLVYKVTANDSIEKLAEKYRSSREKIVAFNDLELTNTLPVDQYIFIPDGEQPPEPVRTPSSFFSVSIIGFTPRFGGGNGYSLGYCTYWAAGRRLEVGNPVPSNWGNANTWDDYARASGYAVDNIPTVGSVFQTDGYGHSIYHVGFVESVNADGSITISEMNYRGWNVPSTRIIPPSEVPKYNYIH